MKDMNRTIKAGKRFRPADEAVRAVQKLAAIHERCAKTVSPRRVFDEGKGIEKSDSFAIGSDSVRQTLVGRSQLQPVATVHPIDCEIAVLLGIWRNWSEGSHKKSYSANPVTNTNRT